MATATQTQSQTKCKPSSIVVLQLSFITEAGSRQSYPSCKDFWGFPGGSGVKNLSASAGNADSSLCWEDPLEEEMATHSRILAWEIPWTEEPVGLQSMGSQELDMT